jgi:hypothetical protein
LRTDIQIEPTGLRDSTGGGFYYPIVFPNDFWLVSSAGLVQRGGASLHPHLTLACRSQLKENQHPINSTTTRLPLRVQYHPLTFFKFTIYASMSASFDAQTAQAGGTGAEMDEIKHMLLETNPWLLGTTILVTILHMVFEFLAFSSDVQHWRKKDKDLVGVSLRTILTNVFVQVSA